MWSSIQASKRVVVCAGVLLTILAVGVIVTITHPGASHVRQSASTQPTMDAVHVVRTVSADDLVVDGKALRPFDITVNDPTKAQHLYTAIRSLVSLPAQARSCVKASYETRYTLTFTSQGRLQQEGEIVHLGCVTASLGQGAAQHFYNAADPMFWQVVADTLNMQICGFDVCPA